MRKLSNAKYESISSDRKRNNSSKLWKNHLERSIAGKNELDKSRNVVMKLLLYSNSIKFVEFFVNLIQNDYRELCREMKERRTEDSHSHVVEI